MKFFRLPFLFLVGIFPLLALNSCVSTVTVEPDSEKGNDDRIILNLAAPADAPTRDATHKLRYIAMLYEGKSDNNSLAGVPKYRYELIEGEKYNGDKTNQVVFEVTTGNDYTIFLMADYIPADATPKSNNLYADHYYNTDYTTVGNGMLTTLHTPGVKDNDNRLSADFFNNDYYDCFALTHTFTKAPGSVEFDLTLKRVVAKVRVMDVSQAAGDHKLSFSSLKHNLSYNLITSKIWNEVPKERNITLEESRNFSGGTDEELFYFYTFAEGNSSPISFNFALGENNNGPNKIEVNDIEVKANHITTVKGNFIPGSNPQEDPTGDLVYVNVAVDKNWTVAPME